MAGNDADTIMAVTHHGHAHDHRRWRRRRRRGASEEEGGGGRRGVGVVVGSSGRSNRQRIDAAAAARRHAGGSATTIIADHQPQRPRSSKMTSPRAWLLLAAPAGGLNSSATAPLAQCRRSSPLPTTPPRRYYTTRRSNRIIPCHASAKWRRGIDYHASEVDVERGERLPRPLERRKVALVAPLPEERVDARAVGRHRDHVRHPCRKTPASSAIRVSRGLGQTAAVRRRRSARHRSTLCVQTRTRCLTRGLDEVVHVQLAVLVALGHLEHLRRRNRVLQGGQAHARTSELVASAPSPCHRASGALPHGPANETPERPRLQVVV